MRFFDIFYCSLKLYKFTIFSFTVGGVSLEENRDERTPPNRNMKSDWNNHPKSPDILRGVDECVAHVPVPRWSSSSWKPLSLTGLRLTVLRKDSKTFVYSSTLQGCKRVLSRLSTRVFYTSGNDSLVRTTLRPCLLPTCRRHVCVWNYSSGSGSLFSDLRILVDDNLFRYRPPDTSLTRVYCVTTGKERKEKRPKVVYRISWRENSESKE